MSLVEEPGVDDGDLPPPHLPGIVAAFAAAAAVAEAGGATDKNAQTLEDPVETYFNLIMMASGNVVTGHGTTYWMGQEPSGAIPSTGWRDPCSSVIES
jgi:hypothetical protein